jgi:hypothetical protein
MPECPTMPIEVDETPRPESSHKLSVDIENNITATSSNAVNLPNTEPGP